MTARRKPQAPATKTTSVVPPEPIMVQTKELDQSSTPGRMSLRELTEQALLRQVASSGALVNGHGDILYLHGRTGMYLEPAPGDVGVYNILKMARQGLRGELTTALYRAAGTRAKVRRTGLLVKTNGDFTPTTLTITPLAARPETSRQGGEVTDAAATLSTSLFLIILEEGASFDPEQARLAAAGDAEEGATDPDSSSLFRANARIAALRQELWAKEEYLQTANEQLKSATEQSRLAVVVRDAHDAITLQDLDGRILAWNPAAVRMYGWSETEALAMNVHDLVPNGLRQDALADIHQLSRAEILTPYRTQRLKKDGMIIEVLMTSTALVNETGQVYAIATTERAKGAKIGQPSGGGNA